MPALLAVFAHPDDESLSAGGLLARAGDAGWHTGVVTATWTAGTHREGELAEALRVLGAGAPRFLGYANAKVPESAPGEVRLLDAALEDAVARLGGYVSEFGPDVIVTHDALGGLTGHPDHVRTHEVAAGAAEAAGVPLWCATHPESALRDWGALLRPGQTPYAVPEERADLRLDVGPWRERKLAAILAHASEAERGAAPGRIAAMAAETRGRLLGTEWYETGGAGPEAP
ncbi:PIG-L deacetylase family protein [Streptomyces sp. NRRL F-5630]|uniref:PIG-L deacetylase family protein n=1 Tax=unclassified Streptomyces TaxID=2593676 RepID=UPI0004CC188A|nr:PIG-L deacetylase family protein [Streptomyces sp. NRRL F-5630]